MPRPAWYSAKIRTTRRAGFGVAFQAVQLVTNRRLVPMGMEPCVRETVAVRWVSAKVSAFTARVRAAIVLRMRIPIRVRSPRLIPP
jgi:hypothetical protein